MLVEDDGAVPGTRLGVVPQFDALVDKMTPRQHFTLFATLGGLGGYKAQAAVSSVAGLVEIDGDQLDMPSSRLSGGQKRRLSLGCAIIGNSRVLFLDEPTTGLDPHTRNNIWRIIRKIQASNRCIVITTHSLEEAEALCNRIGIMVRGQLRCLGNPTHLKRKFANTYRLTLSTAEGRGDDVDEFVKTEVSPAARPIGTVRRTRVYEIPAGGFKVSTAFELVKARQEAVGIAEWAITQGTLQDVFVSVVQGAAKSKAAALLTKSAPPPYS